MGATRNGVVRVGVAVAMLALTLAPTIGPAAQPHKKHSSRLTSSIGSFTPASADPRFGATFGRGGLSSSGFRFTPAPTPGGNNHRVTVAVRARASTPAQAERTASAASAEVNGIAPYAYNLGVAVGWKHFAILSDYQKVDLGPGVPGSREGADVALSYSGKRWSTRLAMAADRSLGDAPRLIDVDRGVSFDLGGSYSLTSRLDVTGGVRYRMEHDRLQMITDDRRDSQAVYIGTAFRF